MKSDLFKSHIGIKGAKHTAFVQSFDFLENAHADKIRGIEQEATAVSIEIEEQDKIERELLRAATTVRAKKQALLKLKENIDRRAQAELEDFQNKATKKLISQDVIDKKIKKKVVRFCLDCQERMGYTPPPPPPPTSLANHEPAVAAAVAPAPVQVPPPPVAPSLGAPVNDGATNFAKDPFYLMVEQRFGKRKAMTLFSIPEGHGENASNEEKEDETEEVKDERDKDEYGHRAKRTKFK